MRQNNKVATVSKSNLHCNLLFQDFDGGKITLASAVITGCN